MMSSRRGHPRKPDALKKLHGTARKDRTVESTAPATGMPTRPMGLSQQAVRVWKSLGPKLHGLGLLSEIDQSTFAVYCQAYADWLEATRLLNKLGIANWYSETESGYRQVIPEVAVRDKVYQVMQRLETRFGLDPSSRSGIAIEGQQKIANATEEFLFAPRVIA
jgi:P27 family predicted phage terminase small subunit